MPDLVSDATALARSWLDDAEGAVFTDAVLIPFIASTYRDLQKRLAQNGIPAVVDNSATLSLVANTLEVSSSSTPVIPTDLIVPYKLWERPSLGTDSQWVEMQKSYGALKPRAQTATLSDWEWRANKIILIGATVTREVRIRYAKRLINLALVGDSVLINDALDALAVGAAAMAARSRGQADFAKDLGAEYEAQVENVLNRDIGLDQYRRRPRWWDAPRRNLPKET